jgi:hypothetical protein
VEIGDGPAAVIGDESCKIHWPTGWEGAAGRKIRESEDLPEQKKRSQLRGRCCESQPILDKKGISRIDGIDSGFFFVRNNPAAMRILNFNAPVDP